MTADQPVHSSAETRTATLLFAFALVMVAITAVSMLLWGLPALAMIGLAGTLAVFGMLIAYAAGL